MKHVSLSASHSIFYWGIVHPRVKSVSADVSRRQASKTGFGSTVLVSGKDLNIESRSSDRPNMPVTESRLP
jgi:hypothetical protein